MKEEMPELVRDCESPTVLVMVSINTYERSLTPDHQHTRHLIFQRLIADYKSVRCSNCPDVDRDVTFGTFQNLSGRLSRSS